MRSAKAGGVHGKVSEHHVNLKAGGVHGIVM